MPTSLRESSRKREALSGTHSHAPALWVPALRCAAAGTTAEGEPSRDRHAAVGDDYLAGDEACGGRRQEGGDAADLVRGADAPQRRRAVAALERLLVLPQGAREIGLDEPRRDAVDAHVLRPPLDREVAAEGEIGGFRDAVGADHLGAANAGDRRHDDHRSAAPRRHARNGEAAEPEVALDV